MNDVTNIMKNEPTIPESKDLITENYVSVSPAYGRDYKNKALAEKDFLEGKDFIIHWMRSGGTYCSIRDFAPGVKVQIRYKQMASVTIVTVEG